MKLTNERITLREYLATLPIGTKIRLEYMPNEHVYTTEVTYWEFSGLGEVVSTERGNEFTYDTIQGIGMEETIKSYNDRKIYRITNEIEWTNTTKGVRLNKSILINLN